MMLHQGWPVHQAGPWSCPGWAPCQPEAQGQHSPDTAKGTALLLLLPPGTQLLLGQCHLLLHGGGFLFGPSAVLLEKGDTGLRGHWGPAREKALSAPTSPPQARCCVDHASSQRQGHVARCPSTKARACFLTDLGQTLEDSVLSLSCLSTPLTSVNTYIFLSNSRLCQEVQKRGKTSHLAEVRANKVPQHSAILNNGSRQWPSRDTKTVRRWSRR